MGSHLAEELLDAGYAVRVFDRSNRDRRNLVSIASEIEIIEGDFLNESDMRALVPGSDYVFHLVGTTLPANSNLNPVYDVESNVIGSIKLLELCVKAKVRKVVFSSSGGTVYGIPCRIPMDENHPTNPICSYGITKLMIEKYLQMFSHLRRLDYSILRISNPYGERQRPDSPQGVITVFLGCLHRKEPLHIWGDGSVTRDFLYVGDVVRAMRLVMEYSGPQRIFNVSAGQGTSVTALVQKLKDLTGIKPKIVYQPERTFDVPQNVLDNSAIRKAVGWHPETTLEQGIRRTWEWVKRQA